MSPTQKNPNGMTNLSVPPEIVQIGDRDRLKVSNALLEAVGLPKGRGPRPPMTAELAEDGLVRVHVTADIQGRLDEIRLDLEIKALDGDENAQEELEVFKDRYRPITMETDGRLCLTRPVVIFLELQPDSDPRPYLLVRAKGGKIELLSTGLRNRKMRDLRDVLGINR